MQHSVILYLRLVHAQIASQWQYRVSFLLETLSTALVTILSFGTLALILQRFKHIAGWNLAEIAFLYGIVETAFGLMDMIFSGFDPPNFGKMVRLGRLDQILLRPSGVAVQVLSSQFFLRRIGRISQGLIVFLYALLNLNIAWDLGKIIFLLLVFISIVCFFGGLFIIGSTITFWTLESIEVINILTYGGTEMMSYPMNIYSDWMKSFFTYIIPAIFLVYYPALYFLEKPDPLGMPAFAPFLSLPVGFGTLFAASIFFSFGLRHYQSSGT
jgi:ABC-2 type transport system permease protein